MATLKEQIIQLEDEKRVLMQGIRDLKRYVTSSKFHMNPMVNSNDISHRLDEIDNNLFVIEVRREK